MARYLVVANQTLGGADLARTVEERVARGEGRFHILVPTIAPWDESRSWASATTATLAPPSSAPDQARKRAQHRLGHLLARINAAGGQATGEVTESDPVAAVKRVLARETFDEIIVSTLPARVSRWLKMDLPSKVSRMTDVPVTTVEAEG